MTNRGVLLVVVLLAVGAGAYLLTSMATDNARLRQEITALKGGKPGSPAPAASAAPRPASTGAPRVLTDEQHQAMLSALREESGAVKKTWIRVDPNDPEASGFAKAVEGVFQEAGWEVVKGGTDGLVFKPGVYLLVAEEEWPAYGETANKALEAGGIEVTAARGYRAYAEQQAKDKPTWRGVKFGADQTYVVLVGRRPEAKPAGNS